MTPAEAVARAVATWHDEGRLEIDDDAKVSQAEGGAWVAAWVWVADDDGEVSPESA